jgi:hypothetical protein
MVNLFQSPLQLVNALDQGHELTPLVRLLQDAEGRPDLRGWLAADQVALEGIDR